MAEPVEIEWYWFMMDPPDARSSFHRVLEFHHVYGATIAQWPPTVEDAELRYELIREELQELREALDAGDRVAVADALADLDYVVNGAAVAFGINLPFITQEVHRSNMTKLGDDGKPIYREDGKVLKGPNYEEPEIEEVLKQEGTFHGPAQV